MAIELVAGEKVDGESNPAIRACNDYLRMGMGRSLQKLCDRYQTAPEPPPTKRLKTLKEWSAKFGWQERAESYDQAVDAERTVAAEARRREVMDDGLALNYERVAKLKDLAAMLEAEINYEPPLSADEENELLEGDAGLVALGEEYERALRRHARRRPNVWLRDVKGIGSFENFERVEIVRFNTALISEYRGTLDDLAKETGGRHHTVEMTGKDGKDLNLQTQVHVYLPDNGRDSHAGKN